MSTLETMNIPAPPQTDTLEVAGATLTYDVRGDLHADTGHRVLVLIGSPMDAYGFTSLASHFTDRAVVTYDPRGCSRSVRTDGAPRSTPEEHADDVRRLIEHLGVGSVDLFASSGGAVNALALVTAHPEVVATVVAHEPPAVSVVPDGETALAATRDIHDTYQREGLGPAMAKFIAITAHEGPFPEDYLDRPAPDPAAFGLPTEDDGSRDDPLIGQNLVSCCSYQPDYAALQAAPVRLVIAAGEESARQVAGRAAAVIAEGLGTGLTVFPSNHGGFLGDEYGMPGQPEAFAARLREVLDEG